MQEASGISISARTRKSGAKPVYRAVKRAVDVLLSLVGLALLSPLFLIVAAAIRADSRGPAIYTQTRLGKRGRPFRMYKFRSMCLDAEAMQPALEKLNERDGPVFKIAKDPRVTRVGAFLRKTCIDELPQLVNIVRGDMSIVGPRPPLPREVARYSARQSRRLDVTPGLTCFWQVCNRGSASFDDWVEMDLLYIERRGFLVDLAIILKTFAVVFRREGAK